MRKKKVVAPFLCKCGVHLGAGGQRHRGGAGREEDLSPERPLRGAVLQITGLDQTQHTNIVSVDMFVCCNDTHTHS